MNSENDKGWLSKREAVLFEHLRKKGRATLDELVATLTKVEGKEPDRRAVNSSVKYLSFKVSGRGWSLNKISGIGRGNKAEYRLKRV